MAVAGKQVSCGPHNELARRRSDTARGCGAHRRDLCASRIGSTYAAGEGQGTVWYFQVGSRSRKRRNRCNRGLLRAVSESSSIPSRSPFVPQKTTVGARLQLLHSLSTRAADPLCSAIAAPHLIASGDVRELDSASAGDAHKLRVELWRVGVRVRVRVCVRRRRRQQRRNCKCHDRHRCRRC